MKEPRSNDFWTGYAVGIALALTCIALGFALGFLVFW